MIKKREREMFHSIDKNSFEAGKFADGNEAKQFVELEEDEKVEAVAEHVQHVCDYVKQAERERTRVELFVDLRNGERQVRDETH